MRSEPESEQRLRRVFDDHYDELLRYCLRRLSPPDSNDAVAEVFAVAWRRIDQLPVGDEARLWLYGVARNVVHNASRSSRRSRRLRAKLEGLAVHPTPSAESVIVRNEEDRMILAALGSLSVDDQEILRLRAYEGMDALQIATVLGCSDAAARKRLSRAVSRLKKVSGIAVTEDVAGSRAIDKGGDP